MAAYGPRAPPALDTDTSCELASQLFRPHPPAIWLTTACQAPPPPSPPPSSCSTLAHQEDVPLRRYRAPSGARAGRKSSELHVSPAHGATHTHWPEVHSPLRLQSSGVAHPDATEKRAAKVRSSRGGISVLRCLGTPEQSVQCLDSVQCLEITCWRQPRNCQLLMELPNFAH